MVMAVSIPSSCSSSARCSTWSMASLSAALPSLTSPPTLAHCIRSRQAHPSPSKLKLSSTSRNNSTRLGSFSGLAPITPLLSLGSTESTSFEKAFTGVNNGSRFYAMRHGKRVPKLNRPPDQRRALIRGLTTQLLKYGRIKTTRARASAIRKYVDKMITLAKDGSLHKRRQALGFIYEKQIVHALFAEVPERYGERNGGYTRIIRTLPRRGDNAPMAYIELV